MSKHVVPVQGFVDALKAWVDSIETGQPEVAKKDAEALRIFSKFLAEDPEFKVLYKQNLDGGPCEDEAEKATQSVHAFFKTVADASGDNFRAGRRP